MCAGRQAFKSITTRIAGGLDSPERGRQGARSAKLPSASTAKGGGFMQTINKTEGRDFTRTTPVIHTKEVYHGQRRNRLGTAVSK